MSSRPRASAARAVRGVPFAVAAVLAAITPIVVSAARAVHRGWVPIGDDAFFSMRPGDVFTRHHPLLGTWTSASLTAGVNFNNPGPLMWDLLALPQRLAPGGAGLAVGVALINVAAVAGIAVFAHRRGGALITTLAMMVTATLAWSMGSELLYDPWQPHSLVLPFLFFLVLVWSASAGDLPALPWVLGVGSLLVQTHLSYAYLVPASTLWALVGLLLVLRRNRREEAEQWRTRRGAAVRWALIAAGVLLVCWSQPLVEQFTSDGRGNLTRLLDGTTGSSVPKVGVTLGGRIAASILALPPWWLRPSFTNAPSATIGSDQAITRTSGLPSTASAAVSLAIVVALLALVAFGHRRRRPDLTTSRAAVTAIVALVFAVLTAGQLPTRPFGIAAHQFRWLWPIGALTALALVAWVARTLLRPERARLAAGAFAGVTLLVAALNIPVSQPKAGPQYDAWAVPVMRDLNVQMSRSKTLRRAGPILANEGYISFAEPFSAAIMAQLERMDIEFVVADAGPLRQVGPSRRFTGRNARVRIFYLRGDSALTVPPGAEQVAFHAGLSRRRQQELAALEQDLGRSLQAGAVRLNAKGRAALRAGRLPALANRSASPEAVFRSRDLAAATTEDMLDVHGALRRKVERYALLQRDFDRATVSVLLSPVDRR